MWVIVISRWENREWDVDSVVGPFDHETACYAWIDSKFPAGTESRYNLKFLVTTLSDASF